MSDFKSRLVEELNQLSEREEKLVQFIAHSPIYEALDGGDKELLAMQLETMGRYVAILKRRLLRLDGVK